MDEGVVAASLELHVQPYLSSSSSSSTKGGSRSRQPPASICFARLMLPLDAIAAQPPGRPAQLTGLQLRLSPQVAAQAAVTASLQVTHWDPVMYLRHLQQLTDKQLHEHQQMPALLFSRSPVPEPRSSLLLSRSHMAASAAAQAASPAELLLGDVLAKQQALERLQRQLDIAAQCAEAADSRVAQLQTANR